MKLPISLWLELRLLVIIAVKRDQFRGKNSFLESLHIYVTTYGHMTTWQQFCLSTHVKLSLKWNFQDWKRRLDKENLTLGARNDFTSCHYYVKFVVLFEIQEHKLCSHAGGAILLCPIAKTISGTSKQHLLIRCFWGKEQGPINKA